MAKEECMRACKKERLEKNVKDTTYACEWEQQEGRGSRQCSLHLLPVERGNGNTNYHCCVYKKGN